MNEAQGIPLIPMLPTPFRGAETSGAVDANPVIPGVTRSPGLLLLCVTRSGLCTTALPAPSTTTAPTPGSGETPSPRNRQERPSWKGGGTAWQD